MQNVEMENFIFKSGLEQLKSEGASIEKAMEDVDDVFRIEKSMALQTHNFVNSTPRHV